LAENVKLEGIVDITKKPPVLRTATAAGSIRLKKSTIVAINEGQVKKGEVLTTARLAAILAVKDTPRIIPMCHTIPITGIEVKFELEEERVGVVVTVTSMGMTGVEMEALTGVTVGLLNIWDMVKYLEKDETGNYPDTVIDDIVVLEKRTVLAKMHP
jgi:cyclic pyranopterin monophosphate synthase